MRHQSSKSSKKLLNIYILLIAAWIFDFQSEGEGLGLAIQSIFLAWHVIVTVLFIIHDKERTLVVRGFAPFAVAVSLFALTGLISGRLQGQDYYAMLRHTFTIFIYLSATYTTIRICLVLGSEKIITPLLWLCFFYTTSTIFIETLLFGKFDINTVRYQIQGASSVAALALAPLLLVYPATMIQWMTVAATMGILFLTVTRTYIIVLAAQFALLIPFSHRIFSAKFILQIGIVSAFLFSLIFLVPSISERWVDRFFVTNKFDGLDPTLLTRQSEWNYMWETLLSTPTSSLLGSGIAAKTQYSLDVSLGGSNDTSSSVGFGHNNYLSLLFISGFIGGLPLLLIQIWQGFIGARQFVKTIKLKNQAPFSLSWGVCIVIGYLAMNIFAGTFGHRGFSLWYGIGTGLLLVGLHESRKLFRTTASLRSI